VQVPDGDDLRLRVLLQLRLQPVQKKPPLCFYIGIPKGRGPFGPRREIISF
jgi:hypothetical protein